MTILGQTLDSASFVQFGLAGVVLFWFMFRMEKKLDAHTSVINDLVKAISLDVLSRVHINEHVRISAQEVLKRSESRAEARAHPSAE